MGAPGGLLGGSWGPPGGVPGRPWGVPGRPWGVPGGLFGSLGALLERFLLSIIFYQIFIKFRSDFGTLLGASWGALGRLLGAQEGAKMGPKSIKNRTQKQRRKKDALGRLLSRFWADLGSFWEPPGGQNISKSISFCGISRKTTFWKMKRVQERSKSQKEPNLTPKRAPRGPPRGAQEGPKRGPRGSKNDIEI